MSRKLYWVLLVMLVAACQGNSEDSLSRDDSDFSGQRENTYQEDIPPSPKKKVVKATTKEMSIRKEGVEEKVMAKLYISPDNFPLSFHTYIPQDYEVENYDSGEGNVINFRRNEASYKLIVLPKNIDTKSEAIQMAKSYIKNKGRAKEIKDGFRLDSSKTISISTEVGERKGYYYVWVKHYPPEYADGFGPESHFIQENLKWSN